MNRLSKRVARLEQRQADENVIGVQDLVDNETAPVYVQGKSMSLEEFRQCFPNATLIQITCADEEADARLEETDKPAGTSSKG